MFCFVPRCLGEKIHRNDGCIRVQMRVFEEVHAFLVAHPTEVVFLSCVPDEGVVGETFCRLKEISATEVLFCVAASLGDFLGPGLEEGVTLADLVQRFVRLCSTLSLHLLLCICFCCVSTVR